MRQVINTNLSAVLHDIIAEHGLVVKRISEASGVPAQTITNWKAGHEPKLSDYNCVLNAIGMRLVIDCFDSTKVEMFKRQGQLTPDEYKKYVTIEYLLSKKCSMLTCAKAVDLTAKQAERLRNRGRKLAEPQQ